MKNINRCSESIRSGYRLVTALGLAVISFFTILSSVSLADNFNLHSSSPGVSPQYQVQADSIDPDDTDMSDLTSFEFSKKLVPGWNVGNSLEAIGGETAWGNPLITRELMDSIKAAGFNSVRIPVAWRDHADSLVLDTTWLTRVEEVVNYVIDAGMYAVINEHWDNGWVVPDYEHQDSVAQALDTLWTQIAVHFRDYNDSLLFAGTNEVMIEGDYDTPTQEYYTVQNSYNQTFVNTVRSTGGRNYYRYLLVQGFNTNIDYTHQFFVMPDDPVEKRLMVEVHYYDPYNFTLNSNSNITQWGKHATNSSRTETWANESYADGQFQKMKTDFVDEGYGVIIGEYGAIARLELGSDELNAQHAMFREYYLAYITHSIYMHDLVPVYWDNGYTSNNALGLFNRSTGEKAYTDIINTIIEACDSSYSPDVTDVEDDEELPSQSYLNQNYPNPFNPETIISYSLGKQSNVSLRVYDIIGREIGVLINNEAKAPGNYQVAFSGEGLSSGMYFYKLNTDNYVEIKKMMLLK